MKIIYWINFYSFLIICGVGLLVFFHEIDLISHLVIRALIFGSPAAPIAFLTSIILLVSKALKSQRTAFLVGWRFAIVIISFLLSLVYTLGFALFSLASQAFRF